MSKRRLSKPLWVALAALLVLGTLPTVSALAQQIDSGGKALLDPATIHKYVDPLVIPPAMPRTGVIPVVGGKKIDYYEIAVRQFDQQILPAGLPATTVWSYGSVQFPGTVAEGGSFNYPAFTIEAKSRAPVRVRWSNELVRDPVDCLYRDGGPSDLASCNYLPHLLAVDQTLHWANPAGDCMHEGMGPTDCEGTSQDPYLGPVPLVTHLHGGETYEWSDGYPEAWYLPNANDISGYSAGGSLYGTFRAEAEAFVTTQAIDWGPGYAVFEYPNEQPATTLWYHDHALGMTRLNVYAGPAGFYNLRGGPGDRVLKYDRKGDLVLARLPGPAPALGDMPGKSYYEIPVVIQDRSFFTDGSLAYPDNRAFFEGLNVPGTEPFLDVPYIPEMALGGGMSDVSPIWNPEFFGNALITNGKTWPYLDAEPRRYRFRYLNGSQSRFLILRLVTATRPDDPATWVQVPGAFWQIGADQGFLPAPVALDELLLGPAERADVIVDFSRITVPAGSGLYLVNVGPDEPFGGGVPGIDFAAANPATTGQVMQFRLVPLKGADPSTSPAQLVLPQPAALPAADATRAITLNERESGTVCAVVDEGGNVVEAECSADDAFRFGPTQALLGTLGGDGLSTPLDWDAAATENVAAAGDTEVWEIYNLTEDAHPIHIHLVQFQVVNRQALNVNEFGVAEAVDGTVRSPEAWEAGFKDTVVAYPGEVTRVKARFPLAGLFVWHCHILEHEDNEMMRPYCVGASAACSQQGGM